MARAGARWILDVFSGPCGRAIFPEKSYEFSRKFGVARAELEKAADVGLWFA